MNKYITSFASTLFLITAFSISSCSSGGGSDDDDTVSFDGNESPAEIDASNAQIIGETSGEAVQKADSSTGLPTGISVASSTNQINSIVLATVEVYTLPSAEDISGACSTGSASIDIPEDLEGAVIIKLKYNDCKLTGTDITADGKVVIDYDDFGNNDAAFTITYTDFTISDPVSGTTTINLVVECSNTSTCTFNSDFVGSDGVTHRITDFSISGNATDGYDGSATFLHGTHGSVSITINDVTFGGSCDSQPNGGSISFSSSNGSSGTITFNSDCTVSGTWSNSSGSGSF